MPTEPNRELNRAFAAALRRLREGRGMTQEDLAYESGVGRVAIAQMETGRRLPSLATLFRLAEGLRMEASDLVGEVERSRGGAGS